MAAVLFISKALDRNSAASWCERSDKTIMAVLQCGVICSYDRNWCCKSMDKLKSPRILTVEKEKFEVSHIVITSYLVLVPNCRLSFCKVGSSVLSAPTPETRVENVLASGFPQNIWIRQTWGIASRLMVGPHGFVERGERGRAVHAQWSSLRTQSILVKVHGSSTPKIHRSCRDPNVT